MGHSARVTKAFLRYCDEFQPGYLPSRNPEPAPVITDQVEQARRLALEVKRRVGDLNIMSFWAACPDNLTVAQDIACSEKMLALLDSEGDFDKAFALFKDNLKEITK